MSNGPTTKTIDISIPSGKVCWATLVVQAANSQTATITLPNGTGGTTGPVVLFGEGGTEVHNAPTQIFTMPTFDGSLTTGIQFTNSGSNASKVIWNSHSNSISTTIYSQTFTFATEDGTDNDYNDSFLTISWFEYEG